MNKEVHLKNSLTTFFELRKSFQVAASSMHLFAFLVLKRVPQSLVDEVFSEHFSWLCHQFPYQENYTNGPTKCRISTINLDKESKYYEVESIVILNFRLGRLGLSWRTVQRIWILYYLDVFGQHYFCLLQLVNPLQQSSKIAYHHSL